MSEAGKRMQKKVAVGILLSLTTLFAWFQPLPAQSPEEAVKAVTQEACDALREGDVAALERLLAPEFTLVGSNAKVQTRADLLAEVRAGDPEYDVFYNHDMTAHVYGDAAIVQGITSLAGRAGGQPFEVDVRFTDTLIRTDGEWRLVVSHVTGIPD
ncbi:MAG: nuclear transport factor 2 family protein [Gemmatimonadota bacterium]